MKFFKLLPALLLTAVTAMPTLEQRDITSFNSSLSTVVTDVLTLTSAVKGFQSTGLNTLTQYYQIREDAKQLSNDIQSAASTISGGQLSIFDSISLLIERTLLVAPLAAYVLLMIAMKPTFDSLFGFISIRPEILAILQEQQSLTKQVDAQITSVMFPLIAPAMTAISTADQLLFTAAVTVYQQPAPAGHVEVPLGTVPDPSVIKAPSTGSATGAV